MKRTTILNLLAVCLPATAAWPATFVKPALRSAAEPILYRIEANGQNYRAANGANMTAEFAGAVTTIRTGSEALGLEVSGYGWGSRIIEPGTIAKSHAQDQKLERDYSSGLREWFRNRPEGLEQGFVLPRRQGTGTLRIQLAARGQWQVTGRGREILFQRGSAKVRYSGIKAWDARGAALPATLSAHNGGVELAIDDANAQYPVTVDPTYSIVQTLKPAESGANDFFGFSMALSGDQQTAVIGASDVFANGHSGVLYVFVQNAGVWSEQQLLTSITDLGRSMSLSTDGNTLLAAGYNCCNGSEGGAVVYTRTGATWSAPQSIVNTDTPGTYQSYGTAVALSGDGNTALISADGEPVGMGSPAQGFVYVFTRSGNTWTQQQKLAASDGTSGDEYGAALAISRDGTTALVGAPFRAITVGDFMGSFTSSAGGAYILTQSAGVWHEQQILQSSDLNFNDQFGNAVALSSDGSTAAAAAFVRGNLTGAAYLFTGSAGVWTQQYRATAPDGASGDAFGAAMALSDDGNTLLVGAPQKTVNGGFSAGQAYYFLRSAGIWSFQQTLLDSNRVVGDNLGRSMAVVQAPLMLLGASNNNGSGMVYVETLPVSTVNIAAASIPSGLHLTVSGQDVVTPNISQRTPANPLTLNAPGPQAAGSGTQYVFKNWEDNSTSALRTVTVPGSDKTYTATFGAQYQLTVSAGSGGTATPTSGQFSDSGSVVSLQATPATGYAFAGWTGATVANASNASTTITLNAPLSVTANFVPQATIASSPAGLTFSVSGSGCSAGSGYTTPMVLAWTPGSNCVVAFASPQTGVGTQYALSQWEDSSVNPSRSITASASPATYTATFTASQYLLTTSATAGGTVSAGGYINAGTNTSITATPAAGFTFTNFTGATTSTSNPLSLLMDSPKSITANFAPAGAPVLTALITAKADGNVAINERIWTVQLTNSGAGGAANPRITSVQILAASPAANLGLISLGSTTYPAAFVATTLSPGQSTTTNLSILFPATAPATRIQIKINVAADSGYTNSITLSNQTR